MSIINRLDLPDYTYYEKFLVFVCECLTEEIQYHGAPSVNSAFLPIVDMGNDKVVYLPNDFLYYTKIAAKVDNRYITLGLNRKMVSPRTFLETDLCETIEELVETDTTLVNQTGFAPFWYGGQYVEQLYGVGGGFSYAYYKLFENLNLIKIEGAVPSEEILLEYASTNLAYNGQTIVPTAYSPALRAYALWHFIENDPRVSIAEKHRKAVEFDMEMTAIRSLGSFTIPEYLDMVYQEATASIKR
jgi:hypothetical protein